MLSMNSKQIIIIIVIIAAIAGAGVFGYLTLTGDTAGTTSTTASPTINTILPHGKDLNFDKVNEFNETGRQFQYPSVTPSDAGLSLNEIMKQ